MREFVDERGRRWTVWDVSPKPAERRQKNVGPATGVGNRRRKHDPVTEMPLIVTVNWLAFEAHDGERRRLAPIPTSESRWSDASEQELCRWCAMALQVPAAGALID